MDEILQSKAMQEALRLIDELEMKSLDEEASMRYIFSENYKKKKKQILKRAKGNEWIRLPYMVRKVAMITVMILGGLLAVTVSIPAARAKLIRVIEKVFETHMSLKVDEKSPDISKDKVGSKSIYVPYYIPQGYTLADKESVENGIYNYEKEDSDKYIMILYSEYEGLGSVSLSPEHATIEKGKFHQWTSYFTADDDGVTNGLTWFTDKYMFQVTGMISKEEVYKIAEGIKKAK